MHLMTAVVVTCWWTASFCEGIIGYWYETPWWYICDRRQNLSKTKIWHLSRNVQNVVTGVTQEDISLKFIAGFTVFLSVFDIVINRAKTYINHIQATRWTRDCQETSVLAAIIVIIHDAPPTIKRVLAHQHLHVVGLTCLLTDFYLLFSSARQVASPPTALSSLSLLCLW